MNQCRFCLYFGYDSVLVYATILRFNIHYTGVLWTNNQSCLLWRKFLWSHIQKIWHSMCHLGDSEDTLASYTVLEILRQIKSVALKLTVSNLFGHEVTFCSLRPDSCIRHIHMKMLIGLLFANFEMLGLEKVPYSCGSSSTLSLTYSH